MNIPQALSVGVLLLLALVLPLPLYLVSLALFGLPHIIWELGFLRSRYALRWPRSWWYAVCAVLLLQAAMRAGAWLGHVPAESVQIADALALMLLFALVAFAPFRAGLALRAVGLLLGLGMFWLLQREEYLAVLLLLALAHNFTPVLMAWDMAREHPPARALSRTIVVLFLLPLLLAASGLALAVTPAWLGSFSPLFDGQLPKNWGGEHRDALLSAMVLAQSLHYYSVIHLLPGAERIRKGSAVLAPRWQAAAVAATLLLLVYFWMDYDAARKLYGVAAGFHAWLEWPVLLMAFLGRPRYSEPASLTLSADIRPNDQAHVANRRS